MDILIDELATFWARWLWPILQFVIGLGLVIFVHELGHFVVAKRVGIKVLKFSLGMGRRIFSFRRGETEYRLGMFPIGGYVQMLGQDDFKPQSSEEVQAGSWQAAPPSRRLLVLSAGVTMNVVFAALVFVIVYMIGIHFTAPVVGGVKPGFPAATVVLPNKASRAMGAEQAVGLRPGDRILELNGRRVRKFRELIFAAGTSDEGETFRFTIARDVEGREIRFDVVLETKRDEQGLGKPYIFGISSAPVVAEPAEAYYAGDARFKKGDLLGEVNGHPMGVMGDLTSVIELTGKPVELTAHRDGRRVPVAVVPYLCSMSKEGLEILGMAPRVEVGRTQPDSPAARAGLRSGEVIVEYAGISHPSRTALTEANKRLRGKETVIRVLRAGEAVEARVTPHREEGQTVIGIVTLPAQGETVVAAVAKDSPAANAGIRPGAVITRVNDTPVKTWPDVYNALKGAIGKDVSLAYTLDGAEGTAEIGKLTSEAFDVESFFIRFPAIYLGDVEVLRTGLFKGNPAQAMVWGVRDTWEFIAVTYQSLASLIKRRVSPKGAAGPVGIGAAAIGIARKDPLEFVYFMSMLSAIIAVFNFLPLPVLDGGHVVLVLIEKFRGRPLPLKVQAAIQIAGLVLILGLFLALTFQDIMRMVTS